MAKKRLNECIHNLLFSRPGGTGAELIRQHKIVLDPDSPRWRTQLCAEEKKQWRRHKIAQWLPRRWAIKRTYGAVPR